MGLLKVEMSGQWRCLNHQHFMVQTVHAKLSVSRVNFQSFRVIIAFTDQSRALIGKSLSRDAVVSIKESIIPLVYCTSIIL